MFSDKKDKKNVEPGTGQNRISEGTKFTGDISSKGFFRIDGSIEGKIETPSKVVLGKSGKINGTLTCENADIEGTFNGKLQVTGTLTLRASAKIEGEVIVGKLAIEPGAIFNATCTMQGAEQKLTTNKAQHNTNPYLQRKRSKKAVADPS